MASDHDQRDKPDHLVQHSSQQPPQLLTAPLNHSSDDLEHSEGKLKEIETSIAHSIDLLLQQFKHVNIIRYLLLKVLPLLADLARIFQQTGDVSDKGKPLLEEQLKSSLGLDPTDCADNLCLLDF